MQINCLVIEDEPLALKKLTGFINKIEYLKLSKTFLLKAFTFERFVQAVEKVFNNLAEKSSFTPGDYILFKVIR